jgi:chorismate dehydratase
VRPPLRVAAIDFLNPAPLMYAFEHTDALASRYALHSTHPAQCAVELLEGRADLGLIPIAALDPSLAIVPGCTIASLDRVRSIQLVVKRPYTLDTVRTIAADSASRSSIAYAQILFRRFLGTNPAFLSAPADPLAMLAHADAALLIGDPALLALEHCAQIEQAVGPCVWHDLAHEWHTRTELPWVAAVWAVRPEALTGTSPAQLIADLNGSRLAGLAHIDEIVRAWTPRIAIPPATIRGYLTHNLHYALDEPCIEAIRLFRRYASEIDALPPLPELRFLEQDRT